MPQYLTPMPTTHAPGRLFRSAMPFRHDQGQLLDEALALGVHAIVMLTTAQEAREKSGRDLLAEYAQRGFVVIHRPVRDFGVPEDVAAYRRDVGLCVNLLRGDHGVLVHCAAGIGRTGTFLACVLRVLEEIPADEAIRQVRLVVGGAIETSGQEAFVRGF